MKPHQHLFAPSPQAIWHQPLFLTSLPMCNTLPYLPGVLVRLHLCHMPWSSWGHHGGLSRITLGNLNVPPPPSCLLPPASLCKPAWWKSSRLAQLPAFQWAHVWLNNDFKLPSERFPPGRSDLLVWTSFYWREALEKPMQLALQQGCLQRWIWDQCYL